METAIDAQAYARVSALDFARRNSGLSRAPENMPTLYDLQAEQAFLGSMLIALRENNTSVFMRGIQVPDYCFHATQHGEILNALMLLHREGRPATAVELKAVLGTDKVPGTDLTIWQYTGTCMGAATSVDPTANARLIVEYSGARRHHVISNMVTDGSLSAEGARTKHREVNDDVERVLSLLCPRSNTISLADLAAKPLPRRESVLPDLGLLPRYKPSLLYADGGTGKTLLALGLGMAGSAGLPFLGQRVLQGPVILFSSEEDTDEIHCRADDIARSHGKTLADFPDFHIEEMLGADAVMATADRNVVTPTSNWVRVRQVIDRIKPVLVIFDHAGGQLAIDENSRTQVQQCIGMHAALCKETGVTSLILAHPSRSGISTGSGDGGSTQWSNAVRSRLYMTRVETEGVAADPDLRVLRTMKANYGPTGTELYMRWQDGAFVAADPNDALTDDQPSSEPSKNELLFLELLRTYEGEGRPLNATSGANYAPSAFAKDARARGVNRFEFKTAMDRLFKAKRIVQEEQGPPSRRSKRLRATA